MGVKPSMEQDQVLARLNRLEQKNRVLTVLCALSLSVPILSIAGWQSVKGDSAPPADVLRVKRLEVVDARGVPLVTLSPDRLSEGGMITLRDKLGEKRSWWQAGPGTSQLTLSSEDAQGQNDNTLGFTVGPDSSKVLLIGKSGAMISAEMSKDGPHLDLLNQTGKSLFSAPWKG